MEQASNMRLNQGRRYELDYIQRDLEDALRK